MDNPNSIPSTAPLQPSSRALSIAFSKVNALTQEQRDAAYTEARQRIAGDKPTQNAEPTIEDFLRNANPKYPVYVTRTVTALSLTMVAAAFVPSAIRLHAIALETNAVAISDVRSLFASALCTVLLAETGQIAFGISAALAKTWLAKGTLYAGSLISLAIALSGNAAAMGDHAMSSAIAFLETYAPPVLVVITANILKSQFLNAIADRESANIAFKSAWQEWKIATNERNEAWQYVYDHAETHNAWEKALVNALRDALRNANKQSKAVLRELTTQDWYALVMRERSAEEWWEQAAKAELPSRPLAIVPIEPLPKSERNHEATQNGSSSTLPTGEIASTPTQHIGDKYVKVCPECGFRTEQNTPRSATNAMVAHRKIHANSERKIANALLVSANGNGDHQE